MKGPQAYRSESEHGFVPDSLQRNPDSFDIDEKYSQQIGTLKNENEFLRSYVARINAELAIYQSQFPESLIKSDVSVSHDDNDDLNGTVKSTDELPPWITASKYMSPLLVAYDGRIKELQSQIHTYQDDSVALRKQIESLISTNSELEVELQTKVNSLSKKLQIMDGTVSDFTDGNVGNDVICREMKERIEILTETNQILQESEKRWREERKNLTQTISEDQTTIASIKAEITTLNAQLEQSQVATGDFSNTLSSQKETISDLNHQFQSTKLNLTHCTQTITELKTSLKVSSDNESRLKSQLDKVDHTFQEKTENLRDELTTLQKDNSELTANIETLQIALEATQDELSTAASEIELNKKDMTGMVQSLETVENLLNSYKQREISVLQQCSNEKLRADQHLLDKEKTVAAYEHASAEISRLQLKLENDLSEKDSKHEIAIQKLKVKFASVEATLQTELCELRDNNTDMETETEKLAHDLDSLRYEYSQLQQLQKDTTIKLNDEINSLQAQSSEITSDKLRSEQKSERLMKDLSNHKNAWQKEREIRDKQYDELRCVNDSKDLQLIECQQTILTLQQTIDKLQLSFDHLKTTNDTLQSKMTEKLTEKESHYTEELSKLRNHISELQSMNEESEKRMLEMVTNQSRLSERWKAENRSTIIQFQKTIKDLKNENASLTTQNIDFSQKVQQLTTEKQQISDNQHSFNQTESALKSTLKSHETNLKALRCDLKGLQQTEKLLLADNQKLRTELDRCELQLKRMERHASNAAKRAELAKFESNSIHKIGNHQSSGNRLLSLTQQQSTSNRSSTARLNATHPTTFTSHQSEV